MKRESKSNITNVIRKEFDDGEQVTLDELYEAISTNPEIQIDEDKLKHRVRSTIDSLLRTKQIERITKATYQKIS
ncbi:MAG: hypothetical protein HY223_01900 [Thaumarchaeota archaeon]|nr:hypothetical protein [Nitrososphaerota archaeon]